MSSDDGLLGRWRPLDALLARRLAQAAGRAVGDRLGAEAGERARLATAELVTNVLRHGYREEGGALRVDLFCREGSVELVVEDGAPRFDPSSADGTMTPCDPPGSDSESPGVGVGLLQHCADRLQHEALATGNRVTLTFLRRRAGGEGAQEEGL